MGVNRTQIVILIMLSGYVFQNIFGIKIMKLGVVYAMIRFSDGNIQYNTVQ
jgi:hypothetical protein